MVDGLISAAEERLKLLEGDKSRKGIPASGRLLRPQPECEFQTPIIRPKAPSHGYLKGSYRTTPQADEARLKVLEIVVEEVLAEGPDDIDPQTIKWLSERMFQNGLYVIEAERAETTLKVPEYREAIRYQTACWKLDQTEAGQRARALLLENLTPFQRQEFENYGFFHILKWGPIPEERYEELPAQKQRPFFKADDPRIFRFRLYRLDRFYPNGNVKLVTATGNKKVASLCLHPEDPYPTSDIVLAQKLVLDDDEITFLKKANFSYGLGTLDMLDGLDGRRAT